MGGAYVAVVGVFPPGQPAPPLHLHPDTDEAFYVAEGDATFLLGDREVPVTTGCLVFVPRGTAHTVWNSGDGLVRGLILISPGEAEHSFVPVEAS
jgi:mannose-6-phosphate isomerase-like protein (cupin superfamily)